MKTDRELLELAAKAAGIGPLDFDYASREIHGFYFGPRLPMPQGVLMAAMHTYWNPLTDDGDALRLAVKLTMMIDYITKPANAYMSGHVVAVSSAGSFYEEGFTEESTRRAIVSAAAAIGEQMP